MTNQNQKYYIGNYKKDAKENLGWFVGYFMESRPRCTEKFEIKHWEYPVGPTNHDKKKQKTAMECTIILRGKIEGQIDGKRIELKAGDYVIIEPGVESGFPDNVLEYVEGITIKVPSLKDDKIVVK